MVGMRFSLSPVRPLRWFQFLARHQQRKDLQALYRAIILERQKMASLEAPEYADTVHTLVEHILNTH